MILSLRFCHYRVIDLTNYHDVVESILISHGIPCRVLCLVFPFIIAHFEFWRRLPTKDISNTYRTKNIITVQNYTKPVYNRFKLCFSI